MSYVGEMLFDGESLMSNSFGAIVVVPAEDCVRETGVMRDESQR
jgi:hypothetical protein